MKTAKTRRFMDKEGYGLIVKQRKGKVIFCLDDISKVDVHGKVNLQFEKTVYKELLEHLRAVAEITWDNFVPKDATSEASDYYEYYDREFDNNGYMGIRLNGLQLERPCEDSKDKFYQFNKRKFQSFLYDLNLKVGIANG